MLIIKLNFFNNLIIFSFLIKMCVSFEPISVAIGSVVMGLSYKYRTALLDNTYCRFKECCNEMHIPFDTEQLHSDLHHHLFGQHIVQNIVLNALNSHKKFLNSSRKPLVMSFHGTPGTGKNYVSDFIAKAIYKSGLNSQYVHKYSGKLDFPEPAKTMQYSERLKNEIKAAIESCSQSLFIFDEVDAMPPGVFDTITALLDHHENIHGVDFRKSIFIFLLNNGGVEIANKLENYYTAGKLRRQDLKLIHFEKVLETAAYNLEGGLKKALSIEKGLIDHYIPFLPLEKEHVENCIKSELKRIGETVTNDKIQSLLEYVTFTKLFAKNGCKRITKKAESHM